MRRRWAAGGGRAHKGLDEGSHDRGDVYRDDASWIAVRGKPRCPPMFVCRGPIMMTTKQ